MDFTPYMQKYEKNFPLGQIPRIDKLRSWVIVTPLSSFS